MITNKKLHTDRRALFLNCAGTPPNILSFGYLFFSPNSNSLGPLGPKLS